MGIAYMVVILLLIVGFGLVIYVMNLKIKELKQESTTQLLKQDITNLNNSVQQINDGLKSHLTSRLDRSQDQITKQYEASNKIIRDVTQKLEKLENTNRNVGEIATELKTLQNVLQNPKQRGVLGEYYLAQILENVLPSGAFELQYKIAEGLVVDAVIKMDNKLLPIDSKFPLENYNRMIEADASKQESLSRAFKEDVKKRIDETSKYIKPTKHTLDQALMFIPSEAIYYDLLANKIGAGGVSSRNMMQYALEKKVTIVGPSTLSAMLQTIGQGLRNIEIHKDTEKIRQNIEQLQKHLMAYNAYYVKLGNSLGATVSHYNNASKELGKIDKDIVKIGGGEEVIEVELLDKPKEIE
ncbi:MAG: DNA recombination protein RmuC [Candidatus Nomurabacteria bacterium]|nr:MAG: DNA recombination protein RmuC [Candidatus Nomurabacteria bacterium]